MGPWGSPSAAPTTRLSARPSTYSFPSTLIKNKIKFTTYIRKFRWDRLQSHIWLTASSYMVKYLRISSYIRKPFLIYDFATDPIWIFLYMRTILYLFYQCTIDKRHIRRKIKDPYSRFPNCRFLYEFWRVFQTLGSRGKKVLKFPQSAMFNSCSRRQADLQMLAEPEEIWNEYSMLGWSGRPLIPLHIYSSWFYCKKKERYSRWRPWKD